MKHIKTYEKLENDDIQVGNIYRIEETFDGNMKVVKVLELNFNYVVVKGYFISDNEEHIFKTYRRFLTNFASPEEIIEFETIENSKKYNL